MCWTDDPVAYHQHHPTADPPVQHVESILRNAALFHRRWGTWPMRGWLEAFERQRLVVRGSRGWALAQGCAQDGPESVPENATIAGRTSTISAPDR